MNLWFAFQHTSLLARKKLFLRNYVFMRLWPPPTNQRWCQQWKSYIHITNESPSVSNFKLRLGMWWCLSYTHARAHTHINTHCGCLWAVLPFGFFYQAQLCLWLQLCFFFFSSFLRGDKLMSPYVFFLFFFLYFYSNNLEDFHLNFC